MVSVSIFDSCGQGWLLIVSLTSHPVSKSEMYSTECVVLNQYVVCSSLILASKWECCYSVIQRNLDVAIAECYAGGVYGFSASPQPRPVSFSIALDRLNTVALSRLSLP